MVSAPTAFLRHLAVLAGPAGAGGPGARSLASAICSDETVACAHGLVVDHQSSHAQHSMVLASYSATCCLA